MGVEARTVEVQDNNKIDAAVTAFKPTHVFIEALWVVPEKFKVLIPLHPKVKWYVRLHSNVPFIANEGMAIDWIKRYLELQWTYPTFALACNDKRMVNDIGRTLGTSLYPVYAPNIYQPRCPAPCTVDKAFGNPFLDVGCFGAIRPLKNQLIQAVAAVKFAKAKGKKLFFHMNNSRVEQFGQSNLKNIQALMAATGQVLVLHPWADHNDFLELLADMDICLQVSLSESFNITAADAVSMGVPLVGSEAIPWLPKRSQADVDSAESIYDTMEDSGLISVGMNHAALRSYIELSVSTWNRWLKS